MAWRLLRGGQLRCFGNVDIACAFSRLRRVMGMIVASVCLSTRSLPCLFLLWDPS